MRVVAMIPVRMASSRFPGKPLADICGLPMVEHVRRRVLLSPAFAEVIVATCDPEIMEAVQSFGGRAMMTANTHERCTDRIAEASLAIEADVIVNVQGDEPLVKPEMFDPLLAPLLESNAVVCTNLMTRITSDEDFNSANFVKTVVDPRGDALYFSREPIPSYKKADRKDFPKYRQSGIFAFRRDFLLTLTRLPPTPLEKIESVDMMRAIEHGYKVRMVEIEMDLVGVDTPSDLAFVQRLMPQDTLWPSYR